MTSDVFVLHSQQDAEAVDPLVTHFQRCQLEVRVGSEVDLNNVKESRCVVVCWSQSLTEGSWQPFVELHEQAPRFGFRVIDVRLDNYRLPEPVQNRTNHLEPNGRLFDLAITPYEARRNAIEALTITICQEPRTNTWLDNAIPSIGIATEQVARLALQLLLDRLPNNLWGKSLASTENAKGDGVSQSNLYASLQAINALGTVFASQQIAEVQDLMHALHSPTVEESLGYRSETNHQNIAIAAAIFLMGGRREAASDFATILANKQEETGGWTENGNDQPRLLTTALVLCCLIDLNKAHITPAKFDQQKTIEWLGTRLGSCETLREAPYNDAVSILYALRDLSHLQGVHSELMDHLFDTWEQAGGGLPLTPGGHEIDVSSTVIYAHICLLKRNQHARRVLSSFFKRLPELLAHKSFNCVACSHCLQMLVQIRQDVRDKLHCLGDFRREAVEIAAAWDGSNLDAAGRNNAELVQSAVGRLIKN